MSAGGGCEDPHPSLLGSPAACEPFLSFLPAFCSCCCVQCRPEHPEDGGREKETVPVAVTALEVVGTLLKHLQDHEVRPGGLRAPLPAPGFPGTAAEGDLA